MNTSPWKWFDTRNKKKFRYFYLANRWIQKDMDFSEELKWIQKLTGLGVGLDRKKCRMRWGVYIKGIWKCNSRIRTTNQS